MFPRKLNVFRTQTTILKRFPVVVVIFKQAVESYILTVDQIVTTSIYNIIKLGNTAHILRWHDKRITILCWTQSLLKRTRDFFVRARYALRPSIYNVISVWEKCKFAHWSIAYIQWLNYFPHRSGTVYVRKIYCLF